MFLLSVGRSWSFAPAPAAPKPAIWRVFLLPQAFGDVVQTEGQFRR